MIARCRLSSNGSCICRFVRIGSRCRCVRMMSGARRDRRIGGKGERRSVAWLRHTTTSALPPASASDRAYRAGCVLMRTNGSAAGIEAARKECLRRVSGSREALRPAQRSEPYVQVSPHTAQGSSIRQRIRDRRGPSGTAPAVDESTVISPVAGSRRTTMLVLPPCSRFGSKTALQTAHRPRRSTLENQVLSLIHQMMCYTKTLKFHAERV
jgi:hypothetical protein